MRVNRYSPRTEEVYVQWIKRFIRFHGVRHPLIRPGAVNTQTGADLRRNYAKPRNAKSGFESRFEPVRVDIRLGLLTPPLTLTS